MNKTNFNAMIQPNKILVLAPHTDDGELGCGGAIAHYISGGSRVYYAAFSICERSLPAALPPKILEDECREATAILGIDPGDVYFFNFEVREFPVSRQPILEALVQLNRDLSPDLVFLPSSNDIHQDHQVITQEGIRAFKNISIVGYELPWNNDHMHTNFFLPLTQRSIEKKIEALSVYKSQLERTYMQPDLIRSLAKVRGMQINAAFAEAFEMIRLVDR